MLAWLQSVLVYLLPLEPFFKAEGLQLEAAGQAELKAIIASVSSPDLKSLLEYLDAAADQFAQYEINKLP